MNQSIDIITCDDCGYQFQKETVTRECSNCFACNNCEVYICPQCGAEIVIKPRKILGQKGS